MIRNIKKNNLIIIIESVNILQCLYSVSRKELNEFLLTSNYVLNISVI